ncbi:nucleic-acid-binding protein from mobile element jockey [Plakobranchus ocellatus]|uniref:Nucleic-acid-binding protein from mobile element jockey n=1 Tax=Plakobranchus ocellatus TaxID=259542 RepID=A0AAV4B1A0_9GAST|nr:nucleic-acid-binding protein from mobile element jockey [Plakobranchus ocellatus]
MASLKLGVSMCVGEDKFHTDTVVLIFNSLKPPSRIRTGYLTLDVRPYVPLPMRYYKCHGYGKAPPESSLYLGGRHQWFQFQKPIAFTSCLSEAFERIVNGPLVHLLESGNLLSKFSAVSGGTIGH